MVLRPVYAKIPSTTPASGEAPDKTSTQLLPAWEAVSLRQKQPAAGYWLISQPDHAALSGELAANFVSPHLPRLEPEVVRAIALHDAGWSVFHQESMPGPKPPLTPEGKPLAFTEYPPPDSVRAWTESIGRAEAVAPVGGIIVSRHFCGLAQFRIQAGCDEHDRQVLCAFMERERGRQQRLAENCRHTAGEVDRLLEVLQFCDLLSLYLCCGAEEDAEFPQRLGNRPIQVRRGIGAVRAAGLMGLGRNSEEFYRFDPSPFQTEEGGTLRTVQLGVTAHWYPPNGEPKITTLPFLLC